ncbi:MAG TPA: hypothetical protein VFW30_11565 [Bryocella sp.]|nr:hypothetical protein [Bryocella sp.]
MHASTSFLIANLDVASDIASAGEQARSIGARGSALFPIDRLEALYEMAFLRIFISWETFLEDTFQRCICGRLSLPTGVTLVYPPYCAFEDAELAILDGSSFFGWADPIKVRDLAKRFVAGGYGGTVGGPHQQVISSNLSRLRALKSIRNFIAHKSAKAKDDFEQSALLLSGVSYAGSSPGRFLRDSTSSASTESRLQVFAREFGNLAQPIAP